MPVIRILKTIWQVDRKKNATEDLRWENYESEDKNSYSNSVRRIAEDRKQWKSFVKVGTT